MRAAGVVLFNIRMYRVTYVAFPFIKCSFEERNYVLSNIIAIIAKNTVPCIYYVFNKYLPRNYTVSCSFTITLFYQNTGKKLFFIRFCLHPGREEMVYSKTITKDR